MTRIRVAIADHHPVVVAGLEHELGKRPSLEVLGTARHVAEIVDVLNRTSCDVLVIDHTMPGGKYGDGLSLLATLRRMFPCVRILVFAMENAAISQQITDLGVASTLCKSREIDDVITAIHATHNGLRLMRRTTARRPPADCRATLLSQREVQVLRLYVSGMSITEIAAKLHRTKQTISAQKRNAMRKLGIDSDAQLYQCALHAELPNPDARADADAPDDTNHTGHGHNAPSTVLFG
ncbi:LuxR C-terminal-related transcriptional regulator [Pandoraea sputorum]|uniref:response regulator transcription factor n=1 Tax=Pandoraea sputorum TaxID=93222 RepID=UPI002B2E35E5|nr:response regulator transcription factor [Pandoraea sputorum]